MFSIGFLLIISFSVHLFVWPYRHGLSNYMEAFGLTLTFLVVICILTQYYIFLVSDLLSGNGKTTTNMNDPMAIEVAEVINVLSALIFTLCLFLYIIHRYFNRWLDLFLAKTIMDNPVQQSYQFASINVKGTAKYKKRNRTYNENIDDNDDFGAMNSDSYIEQTDRMEIENEDENENENNNENDDGNRNLKGNQSDFNTHLPREVPSAPSPSFSFRSLSLQVSPLLRKESE
jgi:hypothetical protein